MTTISIRNTAAFISAGLFLAACSADAPADETGAPTEVAAAQETHPGEVIFMQCAACHSVVASEGNKIGPNLSGVVGREAGALESFSYSDGMGEVDLTWTPENLDAFLQNPNSVIPGTTMIFVGIQNDEQRAAVIDYMGHNPE